MRNLLIMVGSPASGKSTWIKENGLEEYTISPDTLRLLISPPQYKNDGQLAITQQNDGQAWKLLDKLVEDRLAQGHFTVVDATHTREKYLRRYKALAKKYRYRLYVKVMNRDLDTMIEWNSQRPEYKRVPVEAINMHYERMKTLVIPNSIEQIDSARDLNEWVRFPVEGRKTWFIGDIHGCLDQLNSFIDLHYNPTDLFVFIGDYIDRGPDNAGVLKVMFELSRKDNVICLEGNHERWLWYWANDEFESIRSREFMLRTKPELEREGVSKKEARQFYRRLRAFYSAKIKGQRVFACHGGVSNPTPNFISAEQLIKGTGKYEDLPETYAAWTENNPPIAPVCLIHGHRNIQHYPINAGKYIFNVDGHVEQGGELRAVQIRGNDPDDTVLFRAENHNPIQRDEEESTPTQMSNALTVVNLRKEKNVRERICNPPHIHSFNFTSRAFRKRRWNKDTIRARGLFVNINTNEVVARAYDKFFNLNEREETTEFALSKSVKFPVTAWHKYNGFLGIVGYDKETKELVFTSKSTTAGDFAINFKRILLSITTEERLKNIVEEGWSLVFEVIDPVNDPHIIKYDRERCVLLDCIKNDFEFEKAEYELLKRIAEKLGVEVKVPLKTINDFASLSESMKWFVNDEDHLPEDQIEGVVLEDANGFMWKLKANYYSKWKYLRSLKDRVFKPDFRISDKAFDQESISFLNWCKDKGEEYIKGRGIIELREEYQNEQLL